MANVIAIQMVSSVNVESNLANLERELESIEIRGATLIVLPECFACFGGGDEKLLAISEAYNDGAIQSHLKSLASKYNVWMVAGTIPIKTNNSQCYTASCLLIDDNGHIVNEYQKIHLFDVEVDDNTGSYHESQHTLAGTKIQVANTPFGRLGLAVCYDVRFPGLFQAMGQIDVLAIPAAFTKVTGSAHWHSLLQARAIELQCYVIAANQGGVHENGRETYGHSMIVSPWGEKLKEIETGSGTISVPIDETLLRNIRRKMPVAQHNKFRSSFIE